jgi:outer membrane protein assembly factor BamB
MTTRTQPSVVALVLAALLLGRGAAGDPPEPLHSAWEVTARRVIHLAISPDGTRVATLDLDGRVRCYNERGHLLWNAHAPDAERLALADGGRLVAAYAIDQPLATTVHLFGPTGEPEPDLESDVAVSLIQMTRDGAQVVVASGDRIRWFRRARSGWRTFDLPGGGPVRQLQFAPGNTLYVAARGDGIRRVRSDGRVLWRLTGEGGRAATISTAVDGQLLASASPVDGPTEAIALQLHDAGGRLIWETTVPGRTPRVRLAAGGSALLLAYEQPQVHQLATRYERRLAYLPVASGGAVRWTKGGALTDPLFAAAGADGRFVVSLDYERRAATANLRLLDERGNRRWVYPCPALVRILASSADGTDLAAYRADGVLQLLEVAPQ